MNIYKVFSCLILIVSLTACSGGGDSVDGGGGGAVETASGRFVDSAVEGLIYVSGNQVGVTDANGTFTYEVGEAVTLYVGGIELGSALGQAVITPVDLVESAADETDSTVINIARFLITLDDDGNPDNGITITDTVRGLAVGYIDFALSSTDFTNNGNVQTIVASLTAATNAGARNLVSSAQAQSHLSASLFGLLAGDYEGTFSGDLSGSWEFTVDGSGNITGSGTDGIDPFTVSGSTSSTGDADVAIGGAGDSSWVGVFDRVGNISGTWSGDGASGIFTGTRQSEGNPPPPAGAFRLFPQGYFNAGYNEEYTITGTDRFGEYEGTIAYSTQGVTSFDGKQAIAIKVDEDWTGITNPNVDWSFDYTHFYTTDPQNLFYLGFDFPTFLTTATSDATKKIPVTANIGDSDFIGNYTDNRGSTIEANWKLADVGNNQAELTFTYITRTDGGFLGVIDDVSFVIDTNGNRQSFARSYESKFDEFITLWEGVKQ